ncbi:MAG: cytochrome c-type biogenesis protein CcmH [Dehalococcoidales bacterium]
MVRKIIGVILVVLIFTVAPVQAGPESVSDISDELVCQCGCSMILRNCSHQECGSREAMTVFIIREMERGQSGAQIIQTFVRQYGEQVLSSPPKKGFNLIAWILPFAAILVGGAIIYAALKKWVGRSSLSATVDRDEIEEIYDEYGRQLEQELRKFTKSGFR